jgi:MFS superfamily sulfate permease-like transporter
LAHINCYTRPEEVVSMQIRILGGLGPLTRKGIISDMLAGVSVAAINIPQVLGYARIAGAPVVTGLYTVVFPLIAFAVFGSSRHLIVAADSATAAIFAGSLAGMAIPASAHYMALVGMVALLTAGLLFMARIFRLGFLADFLSRTVLVGFLTGVGLQVCIAMLSDMTGVSTTSRYTLGRAWQVVQGLSQPHVATLCLAILVAAAVLLGNRFARRLPIALLAVLGTIAASAAFDFAHQGIALIGPVPGGLPLVQLPQVTWAEILAVLPISASCFVMIIAQSAATSRGFALRYQESVDSDADILGLAAANVAASLSGALVVNGSPTQTAMAERMGARSQVAQLTLAVVVITVLIFFTAPLQYLPRCVLAAIVFTIAVGMIDVSRLRSIRRESPGEFALAVITAATVVALGVEQGILLAIALSLFRHVRHSYRPHTMVLMPNDNGTWVPAPATPGRTTTVDLIVYRFGADLFYANANRFADEVRALVQCAPSPIRWFIVDCAAITDLDYSAALSIRDLLAELGRRNIVVVFARVNPYLKSDMDRHCISPVVGENRIFSTLHQAIDLAHGEAPKVAVGA